MTPTKILDRHLLLQPKAHALAQSIAAAIDAFNREHGLSAVDAVAALGKCAELILIHKEDWPDEPGTNVVQFFRL